MSAFAGFVWLVVGVFLGLLLWRAAAWNASRQSKGKGAARPIPGKLGPEEWCKACKENMQIKRYP